MFSFLFVLLADPRVLFMLGYISNYIFFHKCRRDKGQIKSRRLDIIHCLRLHVKLMSALISLNISESTTLRAVLNLRLNIYNGEYPSSC
jgi:hypothetical protein